jgi:hypothetical protein
MLDTPWEKVSKFEFPTENVLVWTSDGTLVRKGIWSWGNDGPIQEGPWFDEAGERINVTHWCWQEDCPNGPPDPPPLKAALSV